jgi:hypothetical protein
LDSDAETFGEPSREPGMTPSHLAAIVHAADSPELKAVAHDLCAVAALMKAGRRRRAADIFVERACEVLKLRRLCRLSEAERSAWSGDLAD